MFKLPEKINPCDELEVQLAPFGEWPNRDADGKEVVQHVTPEAVERLVDSFYGDILVDIDHNSIGGGTEAAAWVTDLRSDPEKGLVGTFRFTDIGADAVTNRRYRFVSVAWTLDDNGEPASIDSVALTNRPNLPVRPILNSRQYPAGGGSAEPTKENQNMDKLKALLGLDAGADEAAVEAAVQALLDRVADMEQKQMDAEAEQFAAENEETCDKETLKNAYLVSPEVAKMIVANLRKMPATTSRCGRRELGAVPLAKACKALAKRAERGGGIRCTLTGRNARRRDSGRVLGKADRRDIRRCVQGRCRGGLNQRRTRE